MPPKKAVESNRVLQDLPLSIVKVETHIDHGETNLVPRPQQVVRVIMTSESSAAKEIEKLKGTENYYVWSLKLRTILRSERLWALTKTKQSPSVFPTTINGEEFSELQLETRKAAACRILLCSVADDLVGTVADYTDPSDAWNALKMMFSSGDLSQVLTLTTQLQTMKLAEGASVEDYIKRARELKNRLKSMGEKIEDRQLNRMVLTGLPRSYQSVVQTLTYLDPSMSFEKLSASLISEQLNCEHWNALHGDEEALAASHKQGGSSNQGRGRGQWRRSPPWYSMPPRAAWGRGQPRPAPP